MGSGGWQRHEGPPSNFEEREWNEPLVVPNNQEGNIVLTKTTLTYRVDDWGSLSIEGQMPLELTDTQEPAGVYGGHQVWERQYVYGLFSGDYTMDMTYVNIEMSDPNQNRIICDLDYTIELYEHGGNKDKTACACSAGTCSIEGGIAEAAVANAEMTENADSSSAGTAVMQMLTEDSIVWSCNVGVLRGFGTMLSGKVQIESKELNAALATPTALKFNHPMTAQLQIPNGGIVPGCRMEIVQGNRVIALRYYENGEVKPIGVDTAGGGLVSLQTDEEGATTALRWQDSTGAAWEFSCATGELLCYEGPEQVRVESEDAALHLVIKRNGEDDSLRQIYSTWDGLLNVEDITSTGYRIALYTPAQVTGVNSEGYYTLAEGATAFKTFDILYTAENGLSITESAPQRQDYICTWAESNGSRSLTRGATAEEQICTTQTRTELEAAQYGSFDVWQLVTTTTKGGVAAACVCEVYQSTPAGNLLLTRVEGYGSESALTTTYEYDGAGNPVRSTDQSGLTTEYWYDTTGRVVKSFTPWRAGDYTLITDYTYANSSAARYSNELVTVTRKLRKIGTETMITLSTESHTYSLDGGIKREEIHTTAAGSAHTHTRIVERWTNDAPDTLNRGRIRMSQEQSGLQTWYTYARTSEYGALYSSTAETRVGGAPLAGQSRRTTYYINAAGNTVREESYILLTSGTWAKLSGTTYSYDAQNRLSGTIHDNGRASTQELSCTGSPIWQVDENGVRTNYTYDSARNLTEISRAAVYDGDTCITPETITEFVRDAAGRITSTVTRIGAMTTATATAYDLAGREISTTDELGRTTTTSYSIDGLTTSVTTPSGATLISTVNPDGSTAHLHGTGQRELYYVYDLNGSSIRETVKLSDNQTTLSQTISNGFGETTVEASASTSGFIYTRHEYNSKGQRIKTFRDTGWNTTPTAALLVEYDAMGNITKKTLALAETPTTTNSPIEEYTYGAEDLNDGIYATTCHTHYNEEGTPLTTEQKQLISDLSATVESKSIAIDERGLTSTQWTDYNTGTKRTSYSTIPSSTITAETVTVDGFAVHQKDNAGITSTAARTYATSGMTITHTDGRGNTITTQKDIAGRTVRTTDAAGNSTHTEYSSCCDQPSKITDAIGNTSCYQYDPRGRKIAEWGTGIQPVCYSYDSADRLISMTTFRASTEIISANPSSRTDGDVTTWAYHDASGMELRKTFADGKGISKTYDAYNRLRTETDGRGVVKTHTYEHARGLLLSTVYSDGTTARNYTYNHLGKLTQVTDDAGTRTFGYNAYNEQETDSLTAAGKTHLITELRDNYARSTGYSYAKENTVQQTVTIAYGADGRISSAGFVHGGEAKNFNYAYLANTHLLQTLTKPNGMTQTITYEQQRDLPTAMAYHRGSTLVAQREYSYDVLGRPTSRTTSRQGSAVNDTFLYTARGELLNAVVNGAQHGYDYDNVGNRRQVIEGTNYAMYSADCLNHYDNIYGAISGESYDFTPTYDDAGNQTSVKTDSGIWTIDYNAENRPTRFTNADNGTVVECTYDFMGRRATKKVTVNGSITLHQRYLYRGFLQIACCDLTRSAHPCLWLITWDPSQAVSTRPLAIQKDASWFTYGLDLTKNICEIYGPSGYIRTAYSYAPYGAVTATGDVSQPIQWSSEFYDSELALVYYNFRHYNPADGRWVSRDFVEHLNLYNASYITYREDWLGLQDITISATYKYYVIIADTYSHSWGRYMNLRSFMIDEKLTHQSTLRFSFINGKLMHEPYDKQQTVMVEGKENLREKPYSSYLTWFSNPLEELQAQFDYDVVTYNTPRHIHVKNNVMPVYDNNGGYNVKFTAEAIASKSATKPVFQETYLNDVVQEIAGNIPYIGYVKPLFKAIAASNSLYSFPERAHITTCAWLKITCNNEGSINATLIAMAYKRDLNNYKIPQTIRYGKADFSVTPLSISVQQTSAPQTTRTTESI